MDCTFAAVFLWYVIRPSKYVLPKVAMLPVSDYVYVHNAIIDFLLARNLNASKIGL